MFQTILVPTDGSEISRETCQQAVAFAKKNGSRILGFYAAKPNLPTETLGNLVDPAEVSRLMEGSDKKAEEYLGYLRTLCADAGVESRSLSVVSERPYEAIVEAAEKEGCDLIFMASHGRSGLRALLIGGQTQKVLTHTKIPVLVWHPQQAVRASGK